MDNIPNEEENYYQSDLRQEIPDYSVRTLLSWSAPGRPFKRRSKQFYLTALLIAFLIEIILFLFSQYLFMFVVASLVFVGFTFSSVPPKSFHYKVSNQGITIEDHFYLWKELYDFYFKRRDDDDVLCVRTKDFLPGELIIPLGELHRQQVREAILPHLSYREFVKPTFMEKSGDWLSHNFPLERS